MASCSPVEAPDGTEATALVPSSRPILTRTVGLPRESRISIASTCAIRALIAFLLLQRAWAAERAAAIRASLLAAA